MQVTIRFKPFFKDPLLSGVKVCTARTKCMGQPGDTFEAFGAQFEIVSVRDVYLYDVAFLWREEGCTSEDHFKEVWGGIHPVARYDDYQMVTLHRFKKTTKEVTK